MYQVFGDGHAKTVSERLDKVIESLHEQFREWGWKIEPNGQGGFRYKRVTGYDGPRETAKEMLGLQFAANTLAQFRARVREASPSPEMEKLLLEAFTTGESYRECLARIHQKAVFTDAKAAPGRSRGGQKQARKRSQESEKFRIAVQNEFRRLQNQNSTRKETDIIGQLARIAFSIEIEGRKSTKTFVRRTIEKYVGPLRKSTNAG